MIKRLSNWLLQAPGLRTATIATDQTGAFIVRLTSGGDVVARCTSTIVESALSRALDVAEGVS